MWGSLKPCAANCLAYGPRPSQLYRPCREHSGLACAASDHAVADFGLAKRLDERKRFAAHPTSVYSVAFNPRGDVLASSGDDLKIKLWQEGQLLRAWQAGSSQVHGLTFSPDGRLLLSVTRDQPPRVWDADSGRLLLDFARLLPNTISKTKWWPAAFSPSGTRIAVGGGESLIILDGRPLED